MTFSSLHMYAACLNGNAYRAAASVVHAGDKSKPVSHYIQPHYIQPHTLIKTYNAASRREQGAWSPHLDHIQRQQIRRQRY
jgi:hypothetical protein